MAPPLHGVRVIELATGVAGCYTGKLLADFGAEVIKVEPPEGDVVRRWGPFPGADPAQADRAGPGSVGALHLHLNTNKRSVTADLDVTADRDLVARLAVGADIVLESFRPGHLDRYGLGFAALQAANPKLVLVSVTPFGQDGPYAGFAGAEIVSYAMGGPMHATGVAEREPLKLAGQLIAYQCGTVATVAALAALAIAEQSGQGSHVDVSNFETQAGSIDRRMVFLQQYLYNGRIMGREPSDAQGLLPTGIYPAADGLVQIGTPPPYGVRLVKTLGDAGLAALLADPNWVTDPEVPGQVEAALYGWLADRTTAQAMAEAQVHHWPLTALRTPAEVLRDPHLAARSFFVETDHPDAGALRQPGPPIRMLDGWALRRPAPSLGRHDAEVRAEVGAEVGAEAAAVSLPETSPATAPAPARVAPGLPLAGVRVLDLSVVWAGPYTTMMLGDLGADVIRVEDARIYNGTRGAVARPPKAQLPNLGWLCAYPDDEPGPHPWNRNAFFNIHARNKRSVTVDLERPEGVEAFLRLAERCDVLVENNSVGVLDKLGIGWDTLHRRNPRLVLVRLPALGLSGPMAGYVGFGANFEALCGLTALRGYRDGDVSSNRPVYYMDAASGAAGAVATLLALRRRERTGSGELVEVAQGENMLNLIGEYLIDTARTGRDRAAAGNRHLADAPQGAYRCLGADRWVVLSVASDEAWLALRRAMDEPAWATDERFLTATGRRAADDELDERLAEWTAALDRWEVTRRCQQHGVAAGPVLDEVDVVNDPHLRSRGFFRRNGSDEVGWHDYPGHLWRWTGPSMRWEGLCPFGAANAEVWSAIAGLSDDELEELRAGGHLLEHYVGPEGTPI